MEGYYDYYPTHNLDRPLVLVSFVNQVSRSVAHTLATTTGLPLVIVDELVEHQLGGSAHKVIEKEGLEVWRATEKREIAKALRSRPASIVALGEGALNDSDTLNRVLDSSVLVYLYFPEAEARRWASQQSAHHSASLWAEVDDLGQHYPEGLRAVFEARRHLFELAHVTIDASRQSLVDTSNLLRDRLPPAA